MKIFLLAWVLTLSINPVFAQKNKPSRMVFDAEPFNINIDNVGSKYQGHDCKKISDFFRKKKMVKDEFESTEDYRIRVQRLKEQRVYGNLGVDDIFALKHRWFHGIPTNYDADKQEVRFERPSSRIWATDWGDYEEDTIEARDTSGGMYRGQTVFGVEMDVDIIKRRVCNARFDNSFSGYRARGDVVLQGVDSATARRIKDRIELIYVGKLLPPFWKEISFKSGAKLDDPSELHGVGDILTFGVLEVWVIDPDTGAVLGKEVYKSTEK